MALPALDMLANRAEFFPIQHGIARLLTVVAATPASHVRQLALGTPEIPLAVVVVVVATETTSSTAAGRIGRTAGGDCD